MSNAEGTWVNDKAEKKNKLFKWEGWKKEGVWILIFLFLLIISYSYYTETSTCRKVSRTACFIDCQFQETVDKFRAEHPGLTVQCNVTTKSCEFFGVKGNDINEWVDEMKNINISILPN